MEEARAALQQALEIRPEVVSQVKELLRRGSPEFVALFEKTVYVGLRRAGLPDIWSESNERPLGWTGLSDAREDRPVLGGRTDGSLIRAQADPPEDRREGGTARGVRMGRGPKPGRSERRRRSPKIRQ
jgi:hypothetical protein